MIDDNQDNNNIKQHLQEDARTQQANVIIFRDKGKAELVQYFHGECFSPVQSTFLKAIKNKHFLTWTGPDANIV